GLAAATLLADVLKGTVAVLLLRWWCGAECGLIAGAGAFLGHLFPVWLGFKGGKGVATYIGVLLGLAWPFALLFGVVWAAVAYFTRYSSLSALVASAVTPVALAVMGHGEAAILFLLLTAGLWYMHRPNIERLIAGTEGRIGDKSAAPAPPSP
ncbi:MAG: glycerol-3-phosphate acyltransferase, partial [Pseudolabrys sp.]|nr:glycerol-3-phosphate acyltransferase [Pseudolabrys sp.]